MTYNKFSEEAKKRRIDPDYSHCIPTSIRVGYIDPNGKNRYAEIPVYDKLDLPLIFNLITKVKVDALAPLKEEILEEEPTGDIVTFFKEIYPLMKAEYKELVESNKKKEVYYA